MRSNDCHDWLLMPKSEENIALELILKIYRPVETTLSLDRKFTDIYIWDQFVNQMA